MQELLLIQTFSRNRPRQLNRSLDSPQFTTTLLSLHQTKQFARTLITSVVHNRIFFISVDSKQF